MNNQSSLWRCTRDAANPIKRQIGLVGVAIAATLVPGYALAQVDDSLPSLTELGLQSPSGANITTITFSGNQAISNAQLTAIAAKWLQRANMPSDIEEMRASLLKLYRDRGYLYAVAHIGLVSDRSDALVVMIKEGRLARILVSGSEGLDPEYLQVRLTENGPLNVNALLDRYRALLSDPLFSKLNSRLSPGVEPGEAVMEVDVARAIPYHLEFAVNNFRPPAIGEDELVVAGWLRNSTGLGDVLEFSIQGASGGTPSSLKWTVPIPASVFSVYASYASGQATVVQAPLDNIGLKSNTSSIEYGLTYPLVETESRRVGIGLGYQEHQSQTELLGMPFSFTPGEPDGFSKSTVWKLSQNWSEVRPSSTFALRSVFSFGQNNNGGNVSAAPTRQFSYWNGQLNWAQKVSDAGIVLANRVGLQLTNDQLLPMERAPIGGVNTVRGYEENQFAGDQVGTASVELRIPFPVDLGASKSANFVLFYDYGAAKNKGNESQILQSVGIGATWRQKEWSAEVYWGSRQTALSTPSNSSMQDQGVSFQIGRNFF